MIPFGGKSYSFSEITAKVRSASPRTLRRYAREVARAPLRRSQVALLPRIVGPRSVRTQLGLASRPGLLRHMRGPAFDVWPHRPGQNDVLAAALRDLVPGVEAEARERADTVVAHRFDLLGSGVVGLGDEIDWLRDFKTGRTWPRDYYRRIDYVNLGEPSDVKVPWELSRCHHFVDLARAYLLTKERRYVEEVATEWRSWLASNPIGYGVNWACTMEVAIRAVNWVWCLSVVAPVLDSDLLESVTVSLFHHGAFIAANVEESEVNGNHYVSDAVGLVALGSLFRSSALGRRWLRDGRRILVEESVAQVYPDGVDHEMSLAYHRLVAELFLTAFLLLDRANVPVPDSCWGVVERMGGFSVAATRPDGTVPMWGDNDDGRLQRFGLEAANVHASLLSSLAIVLRRADFADTSGGIHEDSLWLLGADAAGRFDSILPPPAERAAQGDVSTICFRDAGVAVLSAPEAHVFFDSGPVGLRGHGGHGHNDALAFELWLGGAALFVDPGSFVYTADGAARNRYRSTAAHNTPCLGGQEIAELGDEQHLWTIADDAQAVLEDCGVGEGIAWAVGSHTGYARLVPGLLVRRHVEVGPGFARVWDELPSRPEGWAVRLTLHPSVEPLSVEPGAAVLGCSDGTVRVSCDGGKIELVAATYSPAYGVERPTHALAVAAAGRLCVEVARVPSRPVTETEACR